MRFSGDPSVESVFRKVQEGIIRYVSVGYITHELEPDALADAVRRHVC